MLWITCAIGETDWHLVMKTISCTSFASSSCQCCWSTVAYISPCPHLVEHDVLKPVSGKRFLFSTENHACAWNDRQCNSARAQGFQKTNMASIERSFYLLKTRTVRVIFSIIKHAQLFEKLRPIALAETCRFLTIQSLEFKEIWQKIVLKPRE